MLNATESAVGAAVNAAATVATVATAASPAADMAAQAPAQAEGAVRAAISANATMGDAASQMAGHAADAVNATMATVNATAGASAGTALGASDGLAAAAVPAFSWSGYIQAVGVLFLLVGLLWLALWAVRRHGGLFRSVPGAGGFSRDDLRLEAQLPIGPRKGLMVVRFLNKRLLLGVTDQQITLLTEQDLDHEHGSDDAISDAGSTPSRPDQPGGPGGRGSGGFSAVLGRALGKGRTPSGS